MTIRTRVAAIVLGTMVLAVAVASAAVSRVLLNGFQTLEREDALEDLDRAVAVLEAELDALAFKAVDWAMWDDTYAFLEAPSDDHPWVRSNVVAETFEGLEIEMLAVADRDGSVVFQQTFQLDSGDHPVVVPRALAEALRPGGAFHVIGRSEGAHTGVLRVDGDALLVAARAVTDSTGSQPEQGILVMARWLDRSLVQAWSTRIGLSLDAEIVPPGQPLETGPGEVGAFEGEVRASTTYVGSASGEPLVRLTVSQPRDIVDTGRFSLAILLLVIIATLGAATLLLTPALDRFVLSRLRTLTRQTNDVGRSGEARARVDVDGRDEVTELARSINTMLGSIERAQQEQELRNVELVEALEGKDRFVSTVAHELRTPLTAIKGLALTLLRADDRLGSERREELLGRLSERADGMQNLVEELLTMSRLAAGKIASTPQPVDVNQLVQNLLDDLATLTAGVETRLERDLAAVVDPDHLSRIVINLLDNARRYGAPPIVIAGRRDGDRVRLEVIDHGPGIPEGEAEALFGRFAQGQTTSSEGLGLGLSIVRSLVELNGGAIKYEPVPDAGACFVVTLPATTTEQVVLAAYIQSTTGRA